MLKNVVNFEIFKRLLYYTKKKKRPTELNVLLEFNLIYFQWLNRRLVFTSKSPCNAHKIINPL